MNFDERLAATQAKLDELKTKINNSIDSAKEARDLKKDEILVKLAKMDAAVSDFNRDVEAQVLCDVTSMKEEAKADADAINASLKEAGSKIDASLDHLNASFDDIDKKIDDFSQKEGAKYDAAVEKIQAEFDDEADTVEGDINAAEEDFRLVKERYEGKLNSTLIKVQMHKEQVKANIQASKAVVDKAVQEERILNLLDYADDCQTIALAYAMEAELAVLDACDEIEDYETKYGKLDV